MNLKINIVLADYDGTLAPINVPREESKPSKQLLEVLKQVSENATLGIISMKDYWFLKSRIPFSHVYGCIGGLEIILRKGRAFIRKTISDKIKITEEFYNYVSNSSKKLSCVEIEIKKLANKRIAGLSLDWRHCQQTPSIIQHFKTIAEKLNFYTIDYTEPFIDIMPLKPDKGAAVKFIKHFFRGSVLYLGDSIIDNPAFKISDVSIGVISHNDPKNLESQYFIDFKDVPKLLEYLIKSDMTFNDKLPILKRGVT